MAAGIMNESVISVGLPPLHGVLNPSPTGSTPLILLNSGLVHHVGTSNLSVRMARTVAASDITACRFDFSGIGDSPVRRFEGTHEAREVAEVQEVIDFVCAETNSSGVILFGLCSGADAALATAKVDDRVRGIIQVDPHCFRTPRWPLQHQINRYTDPDAWRRLLRRLQGKAVWSPDFDAAYLEDGEDQSRSEYSQDWLAEAYRSLIARKAGVCVIMTRGQAACYNYHGQFREVFSDVSFGSLLEEHFFKRTRHIITEPEDQLRVIEIVTQFTRAYQDETR